MNIQEFKQIILQRVFKPFSGQVQTEFKTIQLGADETGFQFTTFHHGGRRGNTVLSPHYSAKEEKELLDNTVPHTSEKFMRKMTELGLESSLIKSNINSR